MTWALALVNFTQPLSLLTAYCSLLTAHRSPLTSYLISKSNGSIAIVSPRFMFSRMER